ncbi:MAG: cytochrome c [bacterium]|nr:cytochrome c [bacterium]
MQRYLTVGSLIGIACLTLVGLASHGATAAAPSTHGGIVQVAAAMGNVANGKKLFAANCASCHGANGQGGVGPTLHGQLKNPPMKRTHTALVAWIKNPKPPMPKLYPSPLSAKDVDDLAAYVLATFK